VDTDGLGTVIFSVPSGSEFDGSLILLG